jgi:aryl-alcohol dehydrogenase-like predicted oxidoreductase
MREIAETHQSSIPQIALAWLLHKPAVTSVIIGARKLSQLEDNLKAINVKLSEEEMTRLNEVSALKMEYPSWFLDRPTDRAPGAKGWAD